MSSLQQGLPTEALPWEILPIPRLPDILAFAHNGLAAQEHLVRTAAHPHALVHVVINVHQVCAGGNFQFALRIKDHQIAVATNGNSTLARKQPKNFRGLCGDEADELIVVDPPAMYASVVDQGQTVFDAWPTVGNFGEIVLPQGFLIGKAEWAVIRRDDRDIARAHPPPQRLLVLGRPQGWGQDVFGSFKPWQIVT